MTSETVKQLDHDCLMQTYGRYDIALDHGENATLFDIEGRKYIDFAAGIGTLSLGTANKGYIDAITAQLAKTQHLCNYFYSIPTSMLAEKIVKASGLKRVFFGNSGAEANEGAIKLARKYSFDKYGDGRSTILTFASSFHGRTVTTLAATGQDVFHNYFFPFTEGFKYAPYNDAAAFEEALTDDVCAVMLEVIQGEGGVNLLDPAFAAVIKEKCAKKDILIIIDEVQTGVGRSGKLFAWENFGLKPDIMTLAKGLAGGMPIGAVVAGEKCEDTLGKGMHGSTFGGNPVSAAAGNYVLDTINTPAFLAEVIRKGEKIREAVKAFGSDKVLEVRGYGLMIGIRVTGDPHAIAVKCAENGLIVLTAGKDVIRLLPPLTITDIEIEEGLAILGKMLA